MRSSGLFGVLVLGLFGELCFGLTGCGPVYKHEDQPAEKSSPAPAGPPDAAPVASSFTVMQNGKAVWPPSGPGCDRLEGCCSAGAAVEPSVDLFCQMSVAATDGDCGKALEKVRAYLDEKAIAQPAACRP